MNTNNGDVRSRKWLLTINNPIEKGFTHERIEELIKETKQCVYWCLSDEVGLEGGTFHTHVYLACSSAVRFSVLKKRFEGAHFDVARGTSEENRNYVFKEGKWANSDKVETNHKDSHAEGGLMPVERQGKRNDLDDLYDMIKQGMTDFEILETCPQYMLNTDKIERCRQIVLEARYKKEWRDLHTVYIYGDTGAGKTRSVMEKFGYDNVFRVTDYEHPFDSYKGQDVLVFEEFRSSLRVGEMLNYLDGYPCELRCRYSNKVACFTKIYIISNIALTEQYEDVQKRQRETWQAFLRRIHEVQIFKSGKIYGASTDVYINGFIPAEGVDVPFTSQPQ